MQLTHSRPNSKMTGFTIVELIVVIVVIGILAAIVTISYNGIQRRAADTETEGDLRQAAMKLAAYKAANGRYPESESQIDEGKGFPKTSSDRTYDYTYGTDGTTFCVSSVTLRTGNVFRVTQGSSEVQSGNC